MPSFNLIMSKKKKENYNTISALVAFFMNFQRYLVFFSGSRIPIGVIPIKIHQEF